LNQDKTPLVTAVIPVYNHEKYVMESIRSVIDQSYPKIELIVINDGSKDHSHEMVLTLVEECRKRFSRFEYISRENTGLAATLNQALNMAKGKYFSPLASDDMVLPDKVSCLVEVMESTDDRCAAAIADASFIDKLGQEIFLDSKGNIQPTKSAGTYSTWLEFYTKDRDFDYKTDFGLYQTLLAANYIPSLSGLFRTACLKDVRGWTVGNVSEDWETWLKLTKENTVVFVEDKVTALYRIHGQNSIDIIKDRMLQANLMLIVKEKEYCTRRGLMREWEKAFHGHLFGMLRYGNFPLEVKLHELKRAEITSFIGWVLRARCKTLLRNWQRRF
jgi:alpha-1,3-rhamnosyltransferase